jgi:hypothetical protein
MPASRAALKANIESHCRLSSYAFFDMHIFIEMIEPFVKYSSFQRSLAGGVLLLCFLLLATATQAAELLYIFEPGCPYCKAWEKEIGPSYDKTSEGRRAPLKPIDKRNIDSLRSSLAKPVRFTPTFVLMENGTEIGRLEGYPGEDFFWPLLDSLLENLSKPDQIERIGNSNS